MAAQHRLHEGLFLCIQISVVGKERRPAVETREQTSTCNPLIILRPAPRLQPLDIPVDTGKGE
jgi:hypothetical protein